MTENILLRSILDRLGNNDKDFALFTINETKAWFDNAIELFVKNGILQSIQPAKVIECPGCEEGCMMQINILPGKNKRSSRKFISCDKRNDIGRISVDFEQLKQWQISSELLAKTISKLLELTTTPKKDSKNKQWLLGMFKGKKRNDYVTLTINNGVFLNIAGHSIPLAEVLNFKKRKLTIDKNELIKLTDNPIAKNQRYEPSTVKREAGKLETQARYKSWQNLYPKLKKKYPSMSDVWYSQQIAKSELAIKPNGGRYSAKYIRKHIKI